MRVSDSTVRFRTRPDDRVRYERAAAAYGISLSAWMRRVCAQASAGVVFDAGIKRDLVKMRMIMNRISDHTHDPSVIAAAEEAGRLLQARIGDHS